MTAYATGTSVPAERSRAEIEQMMRRFGADQFITGWDGQAGTEVVAFRLHNRQVRIKLPMPSRTDPLIVNTPAGRRRPPSAIDDEIAKETRRRWRSLVLVIKAKLTAVSDGISTVEREFLADVVLPDGRSMIEWASPQLDQVYEGGGMPALLPGSS